MFSQHRSEENTVATVKGVTMSDLMLDVDQARELKAAFRRGKWTNAEIKRACEGDFLARAREALLGRAEIVAMKHSIDCDADPLIPYPDWKVESHTKRGQVVWGPSQFNLHLSPNQKGGKSIQGHKLREELACELTENANLLDYLLAHPHLIPEEWKVDDKGNTRYIFFWGTVYRRSDGPLYVRFLCFSEGRWQAFYDWLVRGFGDDCPSLVRAS
jgi:hypothetical protein